MSDKPKVSRKPPIQANPVTVTKETTKSVTPGNSVTKEIVTKEIKLQAPATQTHHEDNKTRSQESRVQDGTDANRTQPGKAPFPLPILNGFKTLCFKALYFLPV